MSAFAPESVAISHFCLLAPAVPYSVLHGCLLCTDLPASSCSETGWKGVIGEVPRLEQVQAALTERDLYM